MGRTVPAVAAVGCAGAIRCRDGITPPGFNRAYSPRLQPLVIRVSVVFPWVLWGRKDFPKMYSFLSDFCLTLPNKTVHLWQS